MVRWPYTGHREINHICSEQWWTWVANVRKQGWRSHNSFFVPSTVSFRPRKCFTDRTRAVLLERGLGLEMEHTLRLSCLYSTVTSAGVCGHHIYPHTCTNNLRKKEMKKIFFFYWLFVIGLTDDWMSDHWNQKCILDLQAHWLPVHIQPLSFPQM